MEENFNRPISPDPINSVPRTQPQMPIKPVYRKENNLDGSLKLAAIIFSIFLVILSFSTIYSLISKTQGQGEVVTNQEKGNITVSASSTVYATPDIAIVNVGIETTGTSLKEATAESLRKATNIINFAQGEGVLSENIKTVEFSIEPQYQKQAKGITISSYKVKEVIEIKMDVDNIESIISSALNAGANTVSDLTFEVGNKDAYVKEARDLAIKKAGEKAESIAQGLNLSLGSPVSYSDNDYGIIYGVKTMEAGEPIAAGQNAITVNVYVTYSIK
ncbi:MAG: SIMPL domain-containing protein [Candidatus Pacebacteria bacterium]|nr:SIMPL domain-containing protein [Candidatus Paceibacterota bacterium]